MDKSLIWFFPVLFLVSCANPADTQTKTEAHPNALTTEEAQQLIPQAASMPSGEFEEIRKHPPVRFSELKNQSLTALLLALDPNYALRQNAATIKDFRYLTLDQDQRQLAPLDPVLKALGWNETKTAPWISIIQPGHIKKCLCESTGTKANGTVFFRAEQVYAGQAEFTAQRQGEEWQIVSFHMPSYQLTTNRQADGTWKLDSPHHLLGIQSP